MSDTTDKIIAGAILVAIIGGIIGGATLTLNFLFTGNPLKFPRLGALGGSCSESLKVTHNGQPVANLQVNTNTGYYITSTDSNGIATLPTGCFGPVTLTYNGTEYSIALQDGKTVGVQV